MKTPVATSKKEAKAAGLKHFYTGKPCIRGHVSVRSVNNGCLECARLWAAERYAADPAYSAEVSRRWREKHPSYTDANRDRINAHSAAHRERNLAAYAAHRANSRARKLNATPPWFGELDELVMREAADLAKRREAATGFKWEVDHTIPIAGRNVCGLHIHNNIQVIPRAVNRRKSNSHAVA